MYESVGVSAYAGHIACYAGRTGLRPSRPRKRGARFSTANKDLSTERPATIPTTNAPRYAPASLGTIANTYLSSSQDGHGTETGDTKLVYQWTRPTVHTSAELLEEFLTKHVKVR